MKISTNQSSQPIEFDKFIGKQIKSIRRKLNISQEQLAGQARLRCSLDWTSVTVGSIEKGQRRLVAEELLSLPHMLGMNSTELFPELFPVNCAFTFGLNSDVVASDSKSSTTWKVARKLSVSPLRVSTVAHKIWGRSLSEERDRRVSAATAAGQQITGRSLQVLRGHVTRELIEEVKLRA